MEGSAARGDVEPPLLPIEDRLKRLIYLNNLNAKYHSGDKDQFVEWPTHEVVKFLEGFFTDRSSYKRMLKILEAANNDKLLPNRPTLFHILSDALNIQAEFLDARKFEAEKKAEIREVKGGVSTPGGSGKGEKRKMEEVGKQKEDESTDTKNPETQPKTWQEMYLEEVKPELSGFVLQTIKSDEEFFDYIQYVSKDRSKKARCRLPTTVRKVVKKFYMSKTSIDFARSFAKANGYHSWSHKDLIKLARVQSDTITKCKVIKMVLFKREKARKDIVIDDNESKVVSNIIRKSETLRKTKDHQVAVPIIAELKATIAQVEPSLRKSAEVWNAVLPNMSLSEVLHSLPKLYKLGFLKKDSPTQAIVNKVLTDAEFVKDSEIHPIEVFIHTKNFEKGGKPLDPKLMEHLVKDKKITEEEAKKLQAPKEIKCPLIFSNLHRCMQVSLGNLRPFGKRYLLTIDITSKMDAPCLKQKNVGCLEAAAAFAWTLLRIEKDVTVAVFKEKEVVVVQLDKKAQINDHVQKLREHKSGYLLPGSPIEWAMSAKKHFDIFVNFISHREYYATVPKDLREKLTECPDLMRKYRVKVNLPNAKLVTVCFSSPRISIADNSANILDVSGLDFGVPKVLEAFCRGNFC